LRDVNIFIGNLSSENSQKALCFPLRDLNIAFTNELVNALLEETQGYPYFLQYYPYFLIQNIPKKKIRANVNIDKNYLNQILKSLIEKGLIYRVGRGKYRFTLPLFENFLLRIGQFCVNSCTTPFS